MQLGYFTMPIQPLSKDWRQSPRVGRLARPDPQDRANVEAWASACSAASGAVAQVAAPGLA